MHLFSLAAVTNNRMIYSIYLLIGKVEVKNSSAFGMQPKVFIAPHTTEDVKVFYFVACHFPPVLQCHEIVVFLSYQCYICVRSMLGNWHEGD